LKAILEFDLPDDTGELLEMLSVPEYTSVLLALKERMDARRPRRLERMRRDSIRQPTGDANRPGAERPAVLI
jgi:hypothetical protein